MYVNKYDLAGNVVEVTMYDGEEVIPFSQIEY